jgi:spermidine synthase/S-adenosylmethionine/arginine decarboxylase-like enzyme
MEPEEDSSDDEEVEQHRSSNPNAHKMEEGEEKPPTTCETYLKLTGFKDAVYETRSFYQEVAWSENANKPDICMSLDDILQSCNSYRPHYHEPYVHFPAAYLKEMKRIVFIGGGDAMLLHEALKYPNVELVLGLELDQKVVRESLKHFRTQPHFEDPRVQWWFGDAAKSLALLPREWFGTFDLVMVDLSETAMSISVTDDLDIFGALSLLMKPEGIFVKNELYYGAMSKLFDHSVFVYMTDYPILCDQDWAMGSNKIDFLHPVIDGGLMEQNKVRTYEYTPMEDEDDHYKLIKDYSHNDARKQGKCNTYDEEQAKAKTGELKKDPVKPTRSAGVLMVVEADQVPAGKYGDLEASIKSILEKQGMHPLAPAVTHNVSSDDVSSAFFIAMEEGYVDAHFYPSKSHIGLEVVLWSKIAKQDDISDAILSTIGVESTFSKFRVIHGGMLGAKNWKEDVEAVGPVKKNLRECDPEVKAAEPQIGQGPIPSDVFNAAVGAGLSMLPKKMDKVVAVLCDSKDCKTVESLKQNPKVDKIVAIYSCPDDESAKVQSDNEDVVSNVYACTSKDLKKAAKTEEGFSAVVVDPAASAAFVGDMQEEFCKKGDMVGQNLLRPEVTFMTSLSNDHEEAFFKGCVRSLTKHMVRSSRIILDKTAEFGVIGTANPGFVKRVVTLSETIEKNTGVRTIIDKMIGGPVQQQKKYDPEHYPPNAYDERDSFKQYTLQVPLSSQSLYQLQVMDESETSKITAATIKSALEAVIAGNPNFSGAKRVDFSKEIGDGAVSAAILANGHIIITWDGAGRVTVNSMTFGETYEPVPPNAEVPDMVLSEHKLGIIDVLMQKLPQSTSVSVREQMPRGSNRVVNFKKDIDAIPGCTNHFDLCKDFAKEGDCDDSEEQPWMHKYCSLSCGTCDEFIPKLAL